MADAEPHPPVIRRAQHAVHAAQPVMPGRAAAALHPHLARHQVEFVMERGDRLGRQLVERGGLPAPTRRTRSCRSAASAPGSSRRRRCPRLTSPLKRCRHGEKPWRMAIVSIAMKPMLCRFRAIPGSGLPRPTQSSMTSAPIRPRRFAPPPAPPRAGAASRLPAPPAQPEPPPRAVASAATSACLVGGATVATTKSRSITGADVLGALQVVPAHRVVEVERGRDRR